MFMLNAAVVGLGWWGKQITSCLAGNDKINIVRGVDIDPEVAGAFASEHGLEITDNFELVLQDDNIDAVIIATPHGMHEEQVIAAARAGKHIFCEKPFALNAVSARRMLETCKAAGLIVGVGHQRRYEGAFEEIGRMLQAGELGKLLHLECNWSHNNFTKAAVPPWRKDPEQAPAGVLTALGIHITDYFQSLAGPVTQVYARKADISDKYPMDDIVSVHFTFSCGATGFLCNLATTPFYERISVFGDGGWAELREWSHVDVPEPSHLLWRLLDDEQHSRTFKYTDSVTANLEEWADAVTGQGTYRYSNTQILHNVEILEAIVRSAETGEIVTLA